MGQGKQEPRYTWRYPGFKQPDEHPVVCVTWNDAKAFCDWLGSKENVAYRLPTEAEWEYACRAGTTFPYFTGNDERSLQGHAHISNLATAAANPLIVVSADWNDGFPFTAPVGQFKPNALGLYDMHGNVWEWCADWYRHDYYAKSPRENPNGPPSGVAEGHVIRGGQGLGDRAWKCQSAFRGANLRAGYQFGFRIERELAYPVQKPDGSMEMLKPSEFQKRVAALAQAKVPEKPPVAEQPAPADGAAKPSAALVPTANISPPVHTPAAPPKTESPPTDDILPGVVARPARIPGIGRWQVETAVPRSRITAIAWSPDGQLLACGTGGGKIGAKNGRKTGSGLISIAQPGEFA
jgi:hypothetical protein